MTLKLSDKTIVRITIFSFLIAMTIMVIVFMVATTYQIPFKEITGDPALTFQANPLTGVISNIGVLFWGATASICLFSSLILGSKHHKDESIFLACSGLTTGILLVDDFFMVHDYIFYSIGLNQYVMYAIYLLIFTSFFLYFKTRILRSKNLLLLLLAFFFLGSSIGLDILIKNEGMEYFFEDALKFFGIISWFLFFTTTSFYAIKNRSSDIT